MPEKENKRKIPEINTELVYKNEQLVNTGIVEKNEKSKTALSNIEATYNFNIDGKNFSYTLSFDEGSLTTSLEKLRDVYSKSGNSIDATYNYLKEQIVQNPNNITNLIMDLCGTISDLYDPEKNHKNIGNTAKEMLENMLSCQDGESLEGFVCMGIHEFGMKMLHECGIPAVVLCGKSEKSNHATLLYQNSEGKFVYNNYDKAMVINAPSITDAIKVVYKESGCLESSGYISILDEKHSYNKFAFEQEAIWANELDKMNYNRTSPFTEKQHSNKTEISGRYEFSNLGNIEAIVNGSWAHGTPANSRQTSVSLGYKNNGETALFNQSNSIGVKLECNGTKINENTNETFFSTKAIVQNIRGKRFLDPIDYSNKVYLQLNEDLKNNLEQFLTELDPTQAEKYKDFLQENFNTSYYIGGRPAIVQDSNNFATFLRGVYGKKLNLINNDNLKLSNSGQASLAGGATFCTGSVFGDARVAIEDGFSLTNDGKNWQIDNSLSVGCVADLKLTSGEQTGGVQPGVKLNAGTSFKATPDDNSFVALNIDASTVALKPYQDYGFSTSIFGGYAINSEKNIYGKIAYSKDIQNIDIGGFNGKNLDMSVFGATLGTEFKNTNLYVSYNKTINGINKTYNNSTVAVGAKVSF